MTWDSCPSYVTEQRCYREREVLDLSQFAFYESTAAGEEVTLGEALRLSFEAVGGAIVGSDTAVGAIPASWQTSNTPAGTPTVTIRFSEPVDVSLAFRSLLATERVTLITPPRSFNSAVQGVSVAPVFVGAQTNYVFHNNNSNIPVIVNYVGVTEVSFEMLFSAAANGNVAIESIEYDRTHLVTCYENTRGKVRAIASSAKGDIREIDVDNIPAEWEPCDDTETCCVFSGETISYRDASRANSTFGQLGAHIPPTPNVTVNNLAIGQSVTEVLQFSGPNGKVIDIAMTMTNQAGGNHPLTIAGSGNFAHSNGGRYGIRFEVLTLDCDGAPVPVSLGFLGASFQAGGEQWWVQGTGARENLTPVDTLIWVNNQVITPPASGVITTPDNNQNAFLVGYENVTVIEAAWNSQANVGSSGRIFLYDGPDTVELALCDILDKVQSANACIGKATKSVYRLSEAGLGEVNLRRWIAPPDAVAHDDVDLIFTGPVDLNTGFPTHPNAPTSQTLEPDWAFAGPDDQAEKWAWVEFDEDTWIRDSNANTGERGEVWIGYNCGAPTLVQQTVVDTGPGRTGFLDPVLVPAGRHLVYVRWSDSAANSGFNLQFGAAEAGPFANVTSTTHRFWSTPPSVECVSVALCDDTPDGFEDCYPEQKTAIPLAPLATAASPIQTLEFVQP